MKALITGASSGIGRDMARYLASKGYDLIVVARRKNRLEELKKELKVNVRIIELDLSNIDNAYKLYELTKDEDIDMLINNAGFGLFGNVLETSLDKELEMIDLNVKTLHILTKLFVKDFIKKDKGRILNVGSSAGFFAGPNLNTYYGTKNYVVKYTMGLYQELKELNSNVHVSVLCPGPIKTEFESVAGGKFNADLSASSKVAKYAVDKCLNNKLIIVPGLTIKVAVFFSRILPYKLSLKIISKIQKNKTR
jgi:short-subunit dehydrogenase